MFLDLGISLSSFKPFVVVSINSGSYDALYIYIYYTVLAVYIHREMFIYDNSK